MRRREFVCFVGLAGLAGCGAAAAEAQERNNAPLVGYLSPTVSANNPYMQAFREGLRDLGYVEGQNIRLEVRYAEGRPERLPLLAAELVALQPHMIVASNTPSNRILKDLTDTIPIVMISVGDPVGLGLIKRLSRSETNFTGL